MRGALWFIFFMLFAAASIYLLGLGAVVILLALMGIIAYIRYIGVVLRNLIMESHQRLTKNQEKILKAIRNVEDSKRG